LLPLRIRAGAESDSETEHLTIYPGMSFEAVERQFILMTLASTGGNKKEAARKFGISRRALYDKLKKHGIM
jgi:DNA-binding NtrC family response regulator